MGRRWRLNENTVDDDSRHDDDPWRDGTAREAQLSEHGQQRLVELERRCLRAVRADEPLTTAGRWAADPAHRPQPRGIRATQGVVKLDAQSEPNAIAVPPGVKREPRSYRCNTRSRLLNCTR